MSRATELTIKLAIIALLVGIAFPLVGHGVGVSEALGIIIWLPFVALTYVTWRLDLRKLF